jgi:hypothetical protein
MKSAKFWRENPAKEYPISSGNYQNTENPRDILLLVHCLHFVSVFGSGINILDPQNWIQICIRPKKMLDPDPETMAP